MASLFTKCCCIGNCFWGWNSLGDLGDDYGYCSHNTSERLFLRIPRPGFATKSIGSWPQSGGSCTCAGGYQLTNTATGASDIIVKYAHFPGESGSRLYNWKWYQPTQCIPPCQDACWGYGGSGTSDADCCVGDQANTPTTCQSIWYSPHPTLSGDFATVRFSKFQRDVCNGTPVNRKANTPVNAKVSDSKDFGNGFRWIDNIADYQTQAGQDRFIKRWWNGSTWITTNNKKLVETMFVVLHRTKWWKRDFNSLHPNDADPEDGSWCGGANEPTCGAYASCRTPEYWDYECAGFPIYTWEVYNAPSNVLSEEEKKAMFVAVNAGVGMDHAALDKLVAHLGCEPKDHGREAGETVKRTLVDDNGDETVHYAFSREAGWLHVCHDKDTSGKFPQWDTNTSAACNALPNSDNCFTAGPFPQETTCTASGDVPICNGNNACNPGLGCSPLIVSCDGSNEPIGCAIDSAVGDCSGIWFHYNQYCDLPPIPPASIRYSCCVYNQAFLCVVPDANTICDCSTFPFEGPQHPIPPGVSAYYRSVVFPTPVDPDPDPDQSDFCGCGGRGTFAPGGASPSPYCDVCDSPNIKVCLDPEDSSFCPQIGT